MVAVRSIARREGWDESGPGTGTGRWDKRMQMLHFERCARQAPAGATRAAVRGAVHGVEIREPPGGTLT
ncbi:hypothetical protein GCM10010345_76530 [Streptomyces canarius]|uniref:Uncharacterized protein n=1 Tax=Streptomyces canarius TaxID=285453 RepID=A0ABQ3D699_9ACTN|nr:hypothetical protein GCM10010345_76530 [Streptomyces canarius]